MSATTVILALPQTLPGSLLALGCVGLCPGSSRKYTGALHLACGQHGAEETRRQLVVLPSHKHTCGHVAMKLPGCVTADLCLDKGFVAIPDKVVRS